MSEIELPPHQILSASEIEKKIGKLPPESRYYLYGDEDEEDEDDTEYPDMLYFEGDITLSESQLKALEKENYHFNIAVKGNFTLEGHFYTGCNNLWVSGNFYCDSLTNAESLRVKGKIIARYYVFFLSDDDEALRSTSKLKIETPYIFSWFYDLSNITLNRDAIVFILCDEDDYEEMALKNFCFYWHDEIFALKPELLYTIDNPGHDAIIWDFKILYKTLQKGESIFIEGLDPNSLLLEKQAEEYERLDRYKEAFAIRKQQLKLSPAYYTAWYNAGMLLYNLGAYEQAIPYFDKAANLFPEEFKIFDNNAPVFSAFARVRLGQLDEALKWADFSIDKNEYATLDLSYRVRAEAYILNEDWDKAKADLDIALKLEYDQEGSSNWLMGLVYHHFGDAQNEHKYHELAKKADKTLEANYQTHRNTDFFYQTAIKVDWLDEEIEIGEIIKDADYWAHFLEEGGYGQLKEVPEEFRTLDICLKIIKGTPSQNYVANAKYFPKDLLTTTELIEALLEQGIHNLRYIPKNCITKELLLKSKGTFCNPQNIPEKLWDHELCNWAVSATGNLNELPQRLLNYDLCLKAVQFHQYAIRYVPDCYRNEQMYLTAVAYSHDRNYDIPSKYYRPEMICKAIDINPMAIDTLPGNYIDELVFNHAKQKIDPDIFAPLAHKHGVNFREHFDRPTLKEDCWEIFWDEKLILNELSKKFSEISGDDIPEKKYTQAIADAVFKNNPYDLKYIPRKFISAEMAAQVLRKRNPSANFPTIDFFSKSVQEVIRSYSDLNE
ncbi:tetratricopeptide repeat protein [Flavobacterium cupreum]|uniref:Tetratricopeptide repeat protein n=1 Tax=Flavobacterium cupreum TaxID=2133766 RepID=A0A434A9M0_9FLAO|nr:tetratricopeptide repeat protein [Flavobacterium cupreum]RUT71068.1 tetratricopeptide repeat protein [Flavobacterium cupreum]